jgi:hypothetical protein
MDPIVETILDEYFNKEVVPNNNALVYYEVRVLDESIKLTDTIFLTHRMAAEFIKGYKSHHGIGEDDISKFRIARKQFIVGCDLYLVMQSLMKGRAYYHTKRNLNLVETK